MTHRHTLLACTTHAARVTAINDMRWRAEGVTAIREDGETVRLTSGMTRTGDPDGTLYLGPDWIFAWGINLVDNWKGPVIELYGKHSGRRLW